MKKISLKNLDNFGMVVLSREELKKVIGGTAETCGTQAGGAACPEGQCCSSYGYCGTGDDYCGASCQSQCGEMAGYPGCIYIGKGNNHSCWYAGSQASGSTLCQRVYGGNCDYENGPYTCNEYCHMN